MESLKLHYAKKFQSILLWLPSIACFLIGLYAAVEHTVHFFANHNYFFSPFADDMLDNINTSYPIALGKASFLEIFHPFVDHRVAIEHIQEIIDILFTNGVQSLQPYRISLLLWLNFFIFSYFVIFSNKSLSKPVKILLSGVYLVLLFPATSINNFTSTMQITWPIIFLFSLASFVSLAKYCETVQVSPSSKKAYVYIFLTVFLLNIALYTFNIGCLLWPIIFFILFKQNCFKHKWLWIGLAIINFYCYLQMDWVSANFFSYTHNSSVTGILSRPLDVFYFISRTLSISFDAKAIVGFPLISLLAGFCAFFLSMYIAFRFLKMKAFSLSETVFYSYFLFIFLSLIVISIMRCVNCQRGEIEARFLTAAFLFLFCLIMSLFFLPIKPANLQKWLHSVLAVLILFWATRLFLPFDLRTSGGTYNLGFFNQVFLSEATGIPIDQNFLQSSKIYTISGMLSVHEELNKLQKLHKKGPYSFWAAQHMQHAITELPFNKIYLKDKAKFDFVYDYRAKNSPGMLVNVALENYYGPINSDWEILFTNKNTIVGFAISAPNLRPLWSMLINPVSGVVRWRGAVNTQLLSPKEKLQGWAVLPKENKLYYLGSIAFPASPLPQLDITNVWYHWQKNQSLSNI